jgi:glycerol-1-phosphate dehydrogenase [NAD(P)+]
MSSERTSAALKLAGDTRSVTTGSGVLSRVDEVFAETFGNAAAVVVADGKTWEAAGQQVQEQLETAGRTLREAYVFPGEPTLYAEYGNITTLAESLRGHDAIPVAVGAGTLNDIVKRAAHETDRPYMVVGTAASMDGYTSFGAAITKDGYKQTLSCPAPRAVLADLDVLTAAPAEMTQSGYADLLAKIPAGADWIVADAMEVEKIDDRVWDLVQGPLREATGRPAELHAGDARAMDDLIEGLMMAGLAMQVAGGSRPASGAEHYFSHLWELEHLAHASHGFKVGIGSISIAAFYERLLQRDLSDLDVDAVVSAWPSWPEVEREVQAAHQTPGLDEAAVRESRAKYIDADALRDRLELLRERWPTLRERLAEQILAPDELADRLRAAGCPTTPTEIGLSITDLKETYGRARMIRSRYTVLDLAHEAGVREGIVEELFAPGGYWAREAVSPA